MVSISVQCPLCCTEEFSSLHSLKYHLLDVMENLKCSLCNEKFHGVRDLIVHLDGCEKKNKKNATGEDIEESLEKSILAKALLKKPGEEPMEEESENVLVTAEEVDDSDAEDGELLYECSTCQLQFASVEEHIKEFHAGTEVVLQVS